MGNPLNPFDYDLKSRSDRVIATISFECAKGNVRDHDARVCPVGFVERRGCHAGMLGWISSAGRRRHLPCFSRPRDGMGTKVHLFVTCGSSNLPESTERYVSTLAGLADV